MTDNTRIQHRLLLLSFNSPSGVSATEEEIKAAKRRACEAAIHLRSMDWPDPLVRSSGSGYNLLYPFPLPINQEARDLIDKVLRKALEFVLDDEVELDINIYGIATIRKGNSDRRG